jgi:hypothetical protein
VSTIEHPLIESASLRKLSWSGVPSEVRAQVWQLLYVRHCVSHSLVITPLPSFLYFAHFTSHLPLCIINPSSLCVLTRVCVCSGLRAVEQRAARGDPGAQASRVPRPAAAVLPRRPRQPHRHRARCPASGQPHCDRGKWDGCLSGGCQGVVRELSGVTCKSVEM